ncbi:MAG TPA: hypothetical protein VFW87_05095, partial [Pirellulales bacterium]|nr:hypothetical protein [Pirellulales bacterium]
MTIKIGMWTGRPRLVRRHHVDQPVGWAERSESHHWPVSLPGSDFCILTFFVSFVAFCSKNSPSKDQSMNNLRSTRRRFLKTTGGL